MKKLLNKVKNIVKSYKILNKSNKILCKTKYVINLKRMRSKIKCYIRDRSRDLVKWLNIPNKVRR